MTTAWTPDQLATDLVSRRDQLLRLLPRRIKRSYRLTEDQRELVVDDALTHVALEYQGAIGSREEAERVFWKAAEFRVAWALDGRGDLVRYRERASVTELDELSGGRDPADIVEAAEERAVAAEFAATLDALESAVMRQKWLTCDDRHPRGWRTIARRLDLSPGRVRAAERSIDAKLKRFAALCVADRLCVERRTEILALAAGAANPEQTAVARAHLNHCSTCKVEYVAQLRAVRSADFARQVASVLPGPVIAEEVEHSRFRELVADWMSRLGGHDAALPQAAASGVGRGSGAVLAAKLAAVLVAGATAVTIALPHDHAPARRPRTQITPTPTSPPRAIAARPTATPAPTVSPRLIRAIARSTGRQTQTTTGASTRHDQSGPHAHESSVPVSPAPSGSLPGGGSEFEPSAANSSTPPPAPAPTAPGSTEFP